jgi:hypothetical protein
MASNLTLKLGRKYLEFFDIFCFGQNSDFIRTISPWSLQIFKIPNSLPAIFQQNAAYKHFLVPESVVHLKMSYYSSNITLFYENSSHIHKRAKT